MPVNDLYFSTPETEAICQSFNCLETGKGSVLHILLAPKPDSADRETKRYLAIYLCAALAFYILPALTALFSPLPLFEESASLKVPYFKDYNLMCMNLLTLPYMIIFLLSERRMIPRAMSSVIDNGIVIPKPDMIQPMIRRTERNYKMWNIASQGIGMFVGVIVGVINAEVVTAPGFGASYAINGKLNLSGWVYVIWQLPIFYAVASIYILRSMVTIHTLYKFNKISDVRVDPFHQDRSGGLRKIGKIGLRNQYLLAISGVNVLCLFVVVRALGYPQEMVLLLVACVILVLFAGPLVFIGPLLPFRRSMRDAKQRQKEKIAKALAIHYHRMVGSLPDEDNVGLCYEKVQQLRELQRLAKRIPVWPLDVGTLEKFVTAYFLPIATAILTFTVERLISWVGEL